MFSSTQLKKIKESIVYSVKGENSYKVIYWKKHRKKLDEKSIHYVTFNGLKDWSCDCWWHANRVVAGDERPCYHYGAVLLYIARKNKRIRRMLEEFAPELFKLIKMEQLYNLDSYRYLLSLS